MPISIRGNLSVFFLFVSFVSTQATAQTVMKIKGSEVLVVDAKSFEVGQKVEFKDSQGNVTASGVVKAKKNNRSIVTLTSGEPQVDQSAVVQSGLSDANGEIQADATNSNLSSPVGTSKKTQDGSTANGILSTNFLKKSQMGLYGSSGLEHGNVIFGKTRSAALDGTVTSVKGYMDFNWSEFVLLRSELGLISDSLSGTTTTSSCSLSNTCSYKSTAVSLGLAWHFVLYQTKKSKFGFDIGGHVETPLVGDANFGSAQTGTISNFTDLALFSEMKLSPKSTLPFGFKLISSLNPTNELSFYRLEAFLGYGVIF